jgi:hypothetical protein
MSNRLMGAVCGEIIVAMSNGVVGRQWVGERAREARQRAAEARQAAERARKRVIELREWQVGSSTGPADAEERRLLAEERLARIEASLAASRQRSVNAHERAARLDEHMGKLADAQRHYDAANDDRQRIEDEAVKAAERCERRTSPPD